MARPVLLAAAVLLLIPSVALAETVVLKSGKRVKAAAVEVGADTVKATLAVDGGTAIVTYPFKKLDPVALLELLDRHLIAGTDATQDGVAALRIAAVAQRFQLLDEAVVWFARAADIDPTLALKRDTGIEAIRTQRVDGELHQLEDLLRSRRAEDLVLAADEMLAGELGLLLTPTEALRVGALRSIAQKILDRESAKAGAAAPAAVKPGAPAPGVSKKQAGALEHVDASLAKAQAARDKATDPALSNPRARKLLETAAKALLDGRRILRELEQPLPDPALERAGAIDEALVITWLDIADLYRQSGSFDTARRYLRAARLIEPESSRAREIESGLVRPERTRPPHEPTLLDYYYSPSPYGYASPAYGSSRYYRRSFLGYGTLGFRHVRHYGFHIGGHGHHHHRGSSSRRVVGRRR